jgi:hypothetical protein
MREIAAWKARMVSRDSVAKAVRSAVRIPCSLFIVPSREMRLPAWSGGAC